MVVGDQGVDSVNSIGGFTELQMEQLRVVVRESVEESVRAAVRSEIRSLKTGRANTSNDAENISRTLSRSLSARSPSPRTAKNASTEESASIPKDADGLPGSPGKMPRDPGSPGKMPRDKGRDTAPEKPLTCMERLRDTAKKLVKPSSWFDNVIAFIILANSVTIAVETQLRLEGSLPEVWVWINSLFLSCFIVELMVRCVANGMENLKSGWFWFDSTLVVGGIIGTWVFDPQQIDSPLGNQLLTLRALRLVRLVKALKTVDQLQGLWKLCCGMSKSLETMVSVCLMLLVVIFVFACLGVESLHNSELLLQGEDTADIVSTNFYSLPMAMLTLIQFANSDSLASIYLPICQQEPWFVIFFFLLWLVVTVGLMNMVTAVIVETAMSNAAEEEDQKLHARRAHVKKLLPEIQAVFDRLDVDGSMALSLEELEEAAQSGELELPDGIKDLVDPNRVLDVFDFLDTDQSGEINRVEFVEGICSIALSAVPIETTQILQLLRSTSQGVAHIDHAMRHIDAVIRETIREVSSSI